MESSNAQKYYQPQMIYSKISYRCVPVSFNFLTFCFLLLEDNHYDSINIKQNIEIQIYK